MKAKKVLRNICILLFIASNIGCDQITKSIVRQKLEYNTQINVIGEYLILTKVENTGAFLGLGNAIPRPIYKIIMIILPLLVIGYALFHILTKNNISQLIIVGVSFIVAGGIGNIYDRILYGSVTDFLYFNFVLFHTGIVNMADISVTTGFFIILYAFYNNRKVKSAAASTF
jgi:signal peptidase II